MPYYMDRHYIEGATMEAMAAAHAKDLDVQSNYGTKFITYWFDEARFTGFCLVEAPNKEALQKVHDEAHGAIPSDIIEVDPSLVESFLGRTEDPAPVVASEPAPFDAAFRAIMFTDLVDSTKMTTTLGDAKAMEQIHIQNAMTRVALIEHRGNEVKHTGDGIMASFGSTSGAVECSMAIQTSFDAHNVQAKPGESLYLRIGLSAGEPVQDHGDLFGSAVQLAARLCSHAEPSQILVAQVVRDLCQGKPLPFADSGEITPKGFDQAVRVYEVAWRKA